MQCTSKKCWCYLVGFWKKLFSCDVCIVFISDIFSVLHIFMQVTTFDLQWKYKTYHRVVIKYCNLILTDVNSERRRHSADESPEVWHDWRHGHAYAPQRGLCSFQPQPSLQFLDDLRETRHYHLLLKAVCDQRGLRITWESSNLFL